MNKLQIQDDWNIAKSRMKQKFGQCTDNDLEYFEGQYFEDQESELIGRIQKRSRKTRKEIESALKGRCGQTEPAVREGTLKIKMLRLVLVVVLPAVLLTALTGCQDSAKSDGTAPTTNASPPKAY